MNHDEAPFTFFQNEDTHDQRDYGGAPLDSPIHGDVHAVQGVEAEGGVKGKG